MISLLFLALLHMHTLDHAALTFVAEADTQNVERRIVFANGATTDSRSATANIRSQTCQTFTAYIRVCTCMCA